ncbi:ABC-type transport system substrate-binding protein [Bradyrhizobium sp. GM22.5]
MPLPSSLILTTSPTRTLKPAQHSHTWGRCLTAKAIDEYTVQISCTEPYAPLLANLATPYLGIRSPEAIKNCGADIGLHPTGTGPFVFSSYKPNESVVLTRNDKYDWNPPALKYTGPPKIASLTFQIVPNAQSRFNQLMAGQSAGMNQTPGVYFAQEQFEVRTASGPGQRARDVRRDERQTVPD